MRFAKILMIATILLVSAVGLADDLGPAVADE